jgi:hypothetical protein
LEVAVALKIGESGDIDVRGPARSGLIGVTEERAEDGDKRFALLLDDPTGSRLLRGREEDHAAVQYGELDADRHAALGARDHACVACEAGRTVVEVAAVEEVASVGL